MSNYKNKSKNSNKNNSNNNNKKITGRQYYR